MRRALPRAAALPLTAALLLAACGDDGAGDGAAPVTAPATVPAPPTVVATTAAPATDPAPPDTAPATTPATPPDTTAAATTPALADTPDLGAVALTLVEVGRFDQPVDIDVRAGEATTLYITEKPGRLVAVSDEAAPRVVLDLTDRTRSQGERGFLGTTFSPDGQRVYAHYSDAGNGDTVLDEYTLDADGTADPASRRELLRVDQPFRNHNGGDVRFGPDGMLYLSLGDGGDAGDPQRNGLDLSTLLGKLLRIDPTPSADLPYTVPPDNPFVSIPGARPEIWSLGLRNAWRLSFDRDTGDLWIGDVGQNALEEVDVAPAEGPGTAGRGWNFGWSAFEGTARYNEDQPTDGAVFPVHEYPHGPLGCSITGGVVYRGTRLPALRGAYLFGDYCAGGVRALPTDAATVTGDAVALLDGPSAVVAFGEDADGEVLVASIDGSVARLEPAP